MRILTDTGTTSWPRIWQGLPEPYYQDDWVALFHGDCRDILPTLTGPVDLLLTDPPYGIGYRSNRGAHHHLDGDDGTLDVAAVLSAACRLLRHNRHAYVFGPLDLSETPLTAGVELVWDKGGPGLGDLTAPWVTSHEPITFAVYEPVASRRGSSGRLAARLRQGSVIRVPRVSGHRYEHPTEKPVALLRQLIESSSCMGETVLDPFAGVGSTLVAAVLEGRRAIGIETDERYCEIAAERLAQGLLDFGEAL